MHFIVYYFELIYNQCQYSGVCTYTFCCVYLINQFVTGAVILLFYFFLCNVSFSVVLLDGNSYYLVFC